MQSSFESKRAVVYWLYSGILLILVMVVIGGMTRLTHSGLSMVHWSFTGSLPPMNEVEWTAEFAKYQTSPEFKELHNHFELEEFKSIFWWEFIHRMFGRFIGVVFIVPFLFFWFKRWIPRKMLPQFLIILSLGAFQALLGWFMVKSGLIDVPRVSHYRLAAHLTTAFITCAYILWVTLQYRTWTTRERHVLPGRKHAFALGGLLLLQIIFGGFVAGLRAGWLHNTWPLMDGDLIAPGVTALEPLYLNFLEGRSGVQFVHRTLALIVLVYTGYLYWQSRKTQDIRIIRPIAIVGVAVLLQVILGVSTLLLSVPVWLAVLHQVFALIVLLSAVSLLYVSTYHSRHSSVDSM